MENYDYSSYFAYFITICTLRRKNYFWKNVGAIIDRPQNVELSPYGKIVDEAIQNISSAYSTVSLESYVIMPNHIHILLRVCADEYGRPLVAPTMSRVVKQLKGLVSKQVGISIWQRSICDISTKTQCVGTTTSYTQRNRWMGFASVACNAVIQKRNWR